MNLSADTIMRNLNSIPKDIWMLKLMSLVNCLYSVDLNCKLIFCNTLYCYIFVHVHHSTDLSMKKCKECPVLMFILQIKQLIMSCNFSLILHKITVWFKPNWQQENHAHPNQNDQKVYA